MALADGTISRPSLSGEIAQRLRQIIRSDGLHPGDRLPAISDLARRFGVGGPTVREALKRLEALGIVGIRHGSGVYVARAADAVVIANPVFSERVDKQLLVDLIDARIPIERRTAALAATHATPAHLDEMRRLLDEAERSADDPGVLDRVNVAFHRQVALASGNLVMHQMVEVLSSLFRDELRAILTQQEGRARDDHLEHAAIHQAIRDRNDALAVQRMQSHLERVRDRVRSSGPESDAPPSRH